MSNTLTPAGDGHTLLVICIVMLILGWTTVATRLYVRCKHKTLGIDDWLMVAGLILSSSTMGCIIAFCYHGGGYRSADIPPKTQVLGIKFYFAAMLTYFCSTIPIKCSISSSLLRIAESKLWCRRILYGIIWLSTISGLVSAILILTVCQPIPALWGEAEGTCNATRNSSIGYFISACSIITDWTLAILPAILLWSIQLKRRVKVSVVFILALGAAASCFTIVRLRFLLLYDDQAEFLWGSARIAIWSILELGIGIFAGSLAHLRPLLRYVPFLRKGSSADGSGGSEEQANAFRSRAGTQKLYTLHGTTAVGSSVRRIYGKGELDLESDGESQEHILDDLSQRSVREGTQGGIRKQTDVTVTHYENRPHGTINDERDADPKEVRSG